MSQEFITWDKSKHATNVEKMDKEHVKLVDLMNRIHQKYEDKISNKDMMILLQELGKMAAHHFENEEAYFESIKYPQANVHKEVHKSLNLRYKKYLEDFAKDGKLTNDFFIFLKSWLGAHIAGIDTKYKSEAFKKAN
jgi:hemerythrin